MPSITLGVGDNLQEGPENLILAGSENKQTNQKLYWGLEWHPIRKNCIRKERYMGQHVVFGENEKHNQRAREVGRSWR